jgi:Planctomycete cytochrome C/WD domain, G-beta repeat
MRQVAVLFFFLTPLSAATNYEQDVRPIFARRCFTCHSASEMRAGLNLESYQGVLKGGGSGDVVKAGRANTSVLYQAVSHEGNGVPLMPLGQPKIPDAEIATIRDWIALGLLENATSQPKGGVTTSLDFKPTTLNKPTGPPAMPQSLPPVTLPEPARAHPVTALAASPWAPLIAVAGHERIYLYDLNTRAMLGELPFPEGVPYVLRFTRDGAKLLAAGGRGVQSGKAVLYDVRTGKRLAAIGQEMDIVLAADITADGKLIAIGGPGKVVKVFSAADGQLLYELKKHTDWITALEFSPDGTRLATGDRAGGIHLWEAATGGIIVSLSEHKDSITSLSWRGDGLLLASGSEDGSIVLWNSHDGFSVASAQNAHAPKPAKDTYGKPPGGVLSVDFMPDGRLVSVGRDRMIKIWGNDGKQKSASAIADGLLTKVTASPDSKLAIAGDYEGRLLLWDGAKIDTIAAHAPSSTAAAH